MNHRQKMTEKQRIEFDLMQYKNRKESMKGHNYEYWNEKHSILIYKKGWRIYNEFNGITSTTSELIAKEAVNKLRDNGFYARIICGYEKCVQRIKHYSIIYKQRRARSYK